MSEGLGAFEEHVSYRPGQQIGTMRTLMKWHAKGAKFYIGADTQPRLLDWCTLGDIASCLGAGKIRLAERVTVKKRVPEPVVQPAAGAPKDDVSRTPKGLLRYIADNSDHHLASVMLSFVRVTFAKTHVEFVVHPKDHFSYDLLHMPKYYDALLLRCEEYFGSPRNVRIVYSDSAPQPEPVEQPAAEPDSRPIPTCETCPARVESCTAPGVFQCRLHPAPSSPLRDKHFCFQHPALAGLMQPVANPAPDECDEPERFLFSGKGRPVVTAPPTVIPPDRPFPPPFEVTCKENGTC